MSVIHQVSFGLLTKLTFILSLELETNAWVQAISIHIQCPVHLLLFQVLAQDPCFSFTVCVWGWMTYVLSEYGVLSVIPPQSSSSLPSCSSLWLSIVKQSLLRSVLSLLHYGYYEVKILSTSFVLIYLWHPPPIILFILYQANPGSCELLISSPLAFPKSVLHQLSSPFLKSSIHFLCTGSFSLWLEVYLDFLHLRRKTTFSKNFCVSLNCYPVPTPFKTNTSYFLNYIWPNYIWLCSCCLFSSSSHRNGSGKVSDG